MKDRQWAIDDSTGESARLMMIEAAIMTPALICSPMTRYAPSPSKTTWSTIRMNRASAENAPIQSLALPARPSALRCICSQLQRRS
jgi:hypothetical protein